MKRNDPIIVCKDCLVVTTCRKECQKFIEYSNNVQYEPETHKRVLDYFINEKRCIVCGISGNINIVDHRSRHDLLCSNCGSSTYIKIDGTYLCSIEICKSTEMYDHSKEITYEQYLKEYMSKRLYKILDNCKTRKHQISNKVYDVEQILNQTKGQLKLF